MEPDGNTARPVVNGIEQAIKTLGDLDHAALKARWRELRGSEPPKGLSRPLLLRALAYAIQEKAYGGLPSALRRRLERLGAELRATGRIANAEVPPAFKPGTRLIREWQNNTHEGYGPRSRLPMERPDLSEPLGGRPSHHRHPLEWSCLLCVKATTSW